MNVFEKLDFSKKPCEEMGTSPGKKGRPYFTTRKCWQNENIARVSVGETKIERARMLAKRK